MPKKAEDQESIARGDDPVQTKDHFYVEDEKGNRLGRELYLEESSAIAAALKTLNSKEGYWAIPITEELKSRISQEGFPLFQQGRGSIELLDDERIIRLSTASESDVSTFLHESGHLFLEMEKVFAEKFGVSENQQAILDYLKADSFEEVTATTPEGVEKHEKFARAFEAYLREGKAPSLKLRDAFAAFGRWLKQLYRRLTSLDVELDDSIRNVFDRLLATEEEITEARGSEAYDQFFKSAEAAGMTAKEFEDYELSLIHI